MYEQNERHFKLAFNTIDKYKNKEIGYSYLVDRLYEIILNLKNPEKSWLKIAKDILSDLEEINAIVLSEFDDENLEFYEPKIRILLRTLEDHLYTLSRD